MFSNSIAVDILVNVVTFKTIVLPQEGEKAIFEHIFGKQIMSLYTLHFIAAVCVVQIVFFLYRKSIAKIPFLLGFFVIPVLSFELFFNLDYGIVNNVFVYLIGYLGCFWCLFLYVFVLSFERKFVSQNTRNLPLRITLFLILQIVAVFISFLIPWAYDTFPLSNVDSILFTLFAPIDGSGEFVISTLKKKVLFNGSIALCAVVAIQLLACLILTKQKIGGVFYKKPLCIVISSNNSYFDKFIGIQKFVSIVLWGCLFAKIFLVPSVMCSPALGALLEKSVDSEFYKKHYKDPLDVLIQKRDDPQNLIFIFVESMANNFEGFTPELNSWKEKGVNFVPGAESVAGTGWTIAGLTSALCGIPLNMPLGKDEYHGKLPTYLPGATCLMNVLQKSGYNQVFVQGSDAHFTQKNLFWEVHGNVAIHDEQYFKQMKKVPEKYSVFWGIEDSKTISFAKEDLDSLSKSDAPFAFYLLTVDGHQPDGFLDPSCENNEDNQYKSVLRCSSKMLNDFLIWIQTQPWFGNTLVFVVGDHTLQSLTEKAGLLQDAQLYTTSFLLNSGHSSRIIKKRFTNMDYSATILEAMGWNLPGHAFGLGRSLLSDEPTMLEIYGRDSLDKYLRQRSVQYDRFLKR